MDDLNNTQLILLTLLVSFVTSIATGIMTFSLLQEAPPVVTQTINRVVEKTVETVTPEGSSEKVREVTTVVVKEEDAVVDAIEKNAKSLIRITPANGVIPDGQPAVFSIGVVISSSGLIVADGSRLVANAAYLGRLSDGSQVSLDVVSKIPELNLIFLKTLPGTVPQGAITPATLGQGLPKLGQTVVSIYGEDRNLVTTGRVTELIPSDSIPVIETDLVQSQNVAGGILINLSGEVVGFKNAANQQTNKIGSFIPTSVIKKAQAEI